MSQLDVSISFPHLLGLILCFYVFIHYITILLIQYWYNQEIRLSDDQELIRELDSLDKTFLLKKVLKL